MSNSYLQQMMPLIERAALGVKNRMRRVTVNAHSLWEVYSGERNRLIIAASKLQSEKTVTLDRFNKDMTREEFEAYLLSNGVWADTEDFDR